MLPSQRKSQQDLLPRLPACSCAAFLLLIFATCTPCVFGVDEPVYTSEQLYNALVSKVNRITLMRPIFVNSSQWTTPVIIDYPVAITSPYRVVLSLCDADCNSGAVPIRPLIIVQGPVGELFLQRIFLRSFIPSTPTQLTGLGPIPAILATQGGVVKHKLVVFHFTLQSIWVFQEPTSWWYNGTMMRSVSGSGPMRMDRSDLYLIVTAPNVKDYVIDTCYSPVDLDQCLDPAAPEDTTLTYCPYTFSDSLRNPYVTKISVFHNIGLDRLAYNFLNPNTVVAPKFYQSCPGYRRSIDLDRVLYGALVGPGNTVTFTNLTFKCSKATNTTEWPPGISLLLSLFALSKDSTVALRDSDVLVTDVADMKAKLSALPSGNVFDPSLPNLQPKFSSTPTDQELHIADWRLTKTSWLQYSTRNANQVFGGNPSLAKWDFRNVTVKQYAPDYCFQAVIDQGTARLEDIWVVSNEDELRAALGSRVRYAQMVADIKLTPSLWPSGAKAVVMDSGVMELRACHPVRGQRYTLDFSNLQGVVQVAGRLLLQGSIRIVNPGWGRLPKDGSPVSVVRALLPIPSRTGEVMVGSVEIEDLVIVHQIDLHPSLVDDYVLTATGLKTATNIASNVTNNIKETAGWNPRYVYFGLYACFQTSPKDAYWSFINTHLIYSFSQSRSVHLAAIVLPSIVGGILLLAAVAAAVIIIRRRYYAPSAPSSELDFEKGGLGSLKETYVDKTGAGAVGGSQTDSLHTTHSDSQTRSRTCPTADIDAARRSLVGAHRAVGNNTDEIVLTQVLGEGSYGRVYRALWRGTTVAVKVIVLPSHLSGREKREKMAVMEAAISSSLSHPNIVQTYTYSVEPIQGKATLGQKMEPTILAGSMLSLRDSTVLHQGSSGLSSEIEGQSWEVRLVQEFCDKGSLRDMLDGKGLMKDGKPDICQVLDTAIDVARAVAHLHKENIIHSDLKPRNVLLKGSSMDPRGFVSKVADFGLSMKIDPGDTHISNAFQGTITHMAPETLMHGHLSKACDVYAFGILLWELYTGGHAFKDVPKALLGHSITKGNKRPVFPADAPFELQLLVCRCWESKADIRPDFDFILEELKRIKSRICSTSNQLCAVLANHSNVGTNSSAQSVSGGWQLPPLGEPADDDQDTDYSDECATSDDESNALQQLHADTAIAGADSAGPHGPPAVGVLLVDAMHSDITSTNFEDAIAAGDIQLGGTDTFLTVDSNTLYSAPASR